MDDDRLRALLDFAYAGRYRFVTPTPATHARVVARPDRRVARSVEDVLGWNLPFAPDEIDQELLQRLRAAGALDGRGGLSRSRVRISSLDGGLYLHSAYPTDERDAVFFGPDSYRFADLIRAELGARPLSAGARALDIGTGAGVGTIATAMASDAARLFATDVNVGALRLARINAAAAGVAATFVHGSGLAEVAPPFDLITINPPYIIDASARAYRDGGGMHGGEVSLDLTSAALPALAPGGRLILYTGSAIVGGEDALEAALLRPVEAQGCALRYREIDPDVFGEELEKPVYAEVDRIALVSAIIARER